MQTVNTKKNMKRPRKKDGDDHDHCYGKQCLDCICTQAFHADGVFPQGKSSQISQLFKKVTGAECDNSLN